MFHVPCVHTHKCVCMDLNKTYLSALKSSIFPMMNVVRCPVQPCSYRANKQEKKTKNRIPSKIYLLLSLVGAILSQDK